jgi:hypothetical protein
MAFSLRKRTPITIAVFGLDADGDETPITTPVLWAVNDPSLATLIGGTNGTATLTGLRAGTVTITATSGNLTASASVEVTPGVPISLSIRFPAA